MAKAFRFNKTKLHSLVNQAESTTVRDTEENSLRFKVGKKRSVFLFEKRISGRKNTPPVTITIGAFPAISIDEARQESRRLTNLCERGIDPRESREKEQRPRVTLRQATGKFMEIKREVVCKKSFREYRIIIEKHFPLTWMDQDINTITSDLLYEQFHEVRKIGRTQCWLFLRVFGNVWNTTAPLFRDGKNKRLMGPNPVPETRLLLKGISRDPLSQPFIPAPLIGKFVVTVENLRIGKTTTSPEQAEPSINVIRMCDIILLSLFTGFRFGEASCLLWEYVDLEHGVLFLPGKEKGEGTKFGGTKNTRDHWLPLSTYAWNMLKRLKKERTTASPYVFPSATKCSRPVSRNHDLYERISQLIGTKFSPHATRRTFASIANEAGLGYIQVKRLLNHAFKGGVTGGYIVPGFNPSKEREYVQRICDYILDQRALYLGQATREKGVDKKKAHAKLRRYAVELGLDPSVVQAEAPCAKAAVGGLA